MSSKITDGVKMLLIKRWQEAQKYERRFWLEDQEKRYIRDGGRKELFYKERASSIMKWIETAASIERPIGRVLEVGSGPLGICGFVDAIEKHSIDSLEHFYVTRPAFTRLRKKSVNYKDGKFENLPYRDKYFDIIITENAIDHTLQPSRALSEAYRVINNGGHLYILTHVQTAFAFCIKWILEKTLKIDKGHPHIFTKSKTKNILRENGFKVIKENCETYLEAGRKNFQEGYWYRKIYTILGLAGMDYRVFCSKS